MKTRLVTRLVFVSLFFAALLIAAFGIWNYTYSRALSQLEKQGRADLAIAADRFTGEMRRLRELAVVMADHPQISGLADNPIDVALANTALQRAVDQSGAMAMLYAAPNGDVLAQAGEVSLSPVGTSYFQRAMNGALGSFYGRLGPDGSRVYAYAAPSFAGGGDIRGALIILADIAALEWDWIGGQPVVFFTDVEGRVFLSNRSEILGWQTTPAAAGLFPPDMAELPVRMKQSKVWRMDIGEYLPQNALHLSNPKPVIGMTGHVLADVAPSIREANLLTGFVVAICLGFGAVVMLLSDRRRALSHANAQLENRVSARTKELTAANTALRHEVSERKEAEAALKRAQTELVQAEKLSALGKMSAGISHELNQPLMAIQQFADNAKAFLDQKKPQRAQQNLERIAGLAARAARIIRNLRAFVRNEAEPMGKVDLVQVISSAIELTETRLQADGVALNWQADQPPIYVSAGEVRLGQVFVNLINNAIDAMAGQSEKKIDILIEHSARLRVILRDTGPGITDANRMFEPFYTTKEVAGGDGLGLGLSISYGLVQSFGGNIKGRNSAEGGAVFTVELELWREGKAA